MSLNSSREATDMRRATLTCFAAVLFGVNAMAAEPTGKAIYEGTCIACHGADGKGTIPGAPDLTDPNGRLAQTDQVLKKHILDGFQSPGSPMAMPPKGGNPALSEEGIDAVLRYMKERFKR